MIFDVLYNIIVGFWGVCMAFLQRIGFHFGIPLMAIAVVGLVINWIVRLLPQSKDKEE